MSTVAPPSLLVSPAQLGPWREVGEVGSWGGFTAVGAGYVTELKVRFAPVSLPEEACCCATSGPLYECLREPALSSTHCSGCLSVLQAVSSLSKPFVLLVLVCSLLTCCRVAARMAAPTLLGDMSHQLLCFVGRFLYHPATRHWLALPLCPVQQGMCDRWVCLEDFFAFRYGLGSTALLFAG
jgi:hypothetical protein